MAYESPGYAFGPPLPLGLPPPLLAMQKTARKPALGRLTPLAVLSLTLLSSCVFVHVKGDLSELDWMDEVIHENHAAPALYAASRRHASERSPTCAHSASP